MKRLAYAAAPLAALLTLAACSSSSSGKTGGAGTPGSSSSSMSMPATSGSAGGGGGGTNQPPPSGAPTITIKDFGYSGSLTVKAGAKVAVVNQDSAPHSLTDKQTHRFDTGVISGGGGTGSFTAPAKPGHYPFGCTIHPSMAGTLIVTA